MALLGNFSDGYTRTGHGSLAGWAEKASFIPWIGKPLVMVLGAIDTVIDGARWLLRGDFASAATVLISGGVNTAVDAVDAASAFSPLWWLNAGSGLTTGRSLGSHARALTETAIGGIGGALGIKPKVLVSYPAGIGSIAGATPAGPGRFMQQAARSRGEDPDAAYQRLMSNQSDHVAALQAAQNGPDYRGV